MGIINKLISKVDVSNLIFGFDKKKPKEEKTKPSLIKEVIDTPEIFKLEAWIENDEIIVKIKKRVEES